MHSGPKEHGTREPPKLSFVPTPSFDVYFLYSTLCNLCLPSVPGSATLKQSRFSGIREAGGVGAKG